MRRLPNSAGMTMLGVRDTGISLQMRKLWLEPSDITTVFDWGPTPPSAAWQPHVAVPHPPLLQLFLRCGPDRDANVTQLESFLTYYEQTSYTNETIGIDLFSPSLNSSLPQCCLARVVFLLSPPHLESLRFPHTCNVTNAVWLLLTS